MYEILCFLTTFSAVCFINTRRNLLHFYGWSYFDNCSQQTPRTNQWWSSCFIRSQTYPDSSRQWSETILLLHVGEWKNWMKLKSWQEKLLVNFEGEGLYLLSFSDYMILQWSPHGFCSMCKNSILIYQWNSVLGLSNLIVVQTAAR
jgi:hypothetical protein